MFDCAPVFCLPACFFPLGVVFVVLCFVIKKPWFPLHLSPRPHLSWQNGSAKMRIQQRRGLGRSPPATISSPLYQRILQYEALSSCRQQGNDVRRFAVEFSGAAEGLGYNDEALKDLFNSTLDEPLSWWRMSGLDHLTFGEFVESLARSPAKVAGVPQVVGDRVHSRARSAPWAHRVRSRARSAPWADRVRSRARFAPWADRVRSRARSVPGAHAVRSIPGAHAVRSVPGAHAVRSKARSDPWADRVRSRARSIAEADRVRSRARSVPGAHAFRSVPGAHAFCSVPGAHAFCSVPGAHAVCFRARSSPGAHRLRSRARSGPGAHAVHSSPGPRSGLGTHRARSRASPTLAPLCAHCSRPTSTPRAWPNSLLDIFLFSVCGASGIRSLKGGLCHDPAGVPRLATRCPCVLSTWLVCWCHVLPCRLSVPSHLVT